MESFNTYSKFCPNVFVAKCPDQHEKGEIIVLTTKYGKEHENEVHNYLGKTKDGFYLYSITRVDGFNAQERAKRKAEKLQQCATNAEKRSTQYYEASKEGRDFLSLGEPIKIGHHSEKRHRALIERNWARMGKSVEESEKAKTYEQRAEYWQEKAKDVNLSMPESLDFYEFKLEEAKKHHKLLKENPEKRAHSMSLQYANKAVKDAEINLKLAVKLWGSDEEIKQLQNEEKEKQETRAEKSQKTNDKIKSLGGFFAFNNDQFKEGYNKSIESGHLAEGEKVTHIKAGLYIPSKNVQKFINGI